MQDVVEAEGRDLSELAAVIVASYVSNNAIPLADLSALFVTVHRALNGLCEPAVPAVKQNEKPTHVQIKKSITPEALISFEDGKPYKTLRRHLTLRGVTPEAYREKWGLSPDYPMTCASYSAQRSELARSIGLGIKRKTAAKTAEPDDTGSEAPKRRGRPPRAA